jgi:hypothetical protein
MSVHPHPITIARLAEERRLAFYAEAERARRAKLAQPTTQQQPLLDHPALRSAAVLLALLHATSQRG